MLAVSDAPAPLRPTRRRPATRHSSPLGATDGELAARAAGGERAAFDEIVRRYDDKLRGVAFKLLGDRDRMDDALQEAYVQAYRSLPRFRHDAQLGSWLYRITYNCCIDELRRAARRPDPVEMRVPHTGEHVIGFIAEPPSGRAGPERQVAAADATARALATLPDDQRVTLVLVDGEGFDNVEAARLLGVAPGTIASRLSRARATLRHFLGEESR